jgi:lipopolysaccharide/colanic/teichoic acid biosynthesis glycosyltransferase
MNSAAPSMNSLVAQERLPAVSPEDLLNACCHAPVPAWLKQLGLPAERKNIRCLRWRTRAAKRVLDIVVAVCLLVLTAPLLCLVAVIIKCSSPGPIIFTQTRVGLNARNSSRAKSHDAASCSVQCVCSELPPSDNRCRRKHPNFGKPFTIYKLRTMHMQASQAGPCQAQRGDARIIPVGRLLRRMRIDELPQLINVLRGEMSMVGPRPECIEYMEELSRKVPGYVQRLGLKPGLTGIAQIEAGYANDLDSYRRKVAYDLLYLQNCSLWNDLRIMLRTVRVVLTGFGAI